VTPKQRLVDALAVARQSLTLKEITNVLAEWLVAQAAREKGVSPQEIHRRIKR